MTDISTLLVRDNLNLRDALQKMNDGRAGILLLVDEEGRLRRTVTDGDIRRLLVGGASVGDTLALLPPKQPVLAPYGAPMETLATLMRQHRVNQIPLVDEEGVPLALVQLYDLETPILLSTPHMGEMEFGFIEQAFDTNWIAPLGPNVDAFETELAETVGVGHAAALSSGTAAIHLALVLLGVKSSDLVFCSSLTFIASANPIVYVGATPVFIDSEPGSWNLSPLALERALIEAASIGRLPKALVVANLYGQSADMDPILALCDEYGVPLIEDAAESLGATYKGKMSGSIGHVGIFSFNGNKIITTSGGGMLVSNDGKLVEKARFLSTQARDRAPYYLHTETGYNYRMSNVLAGIGRGQLRVLEQRVGARRMVFTRYREALRGLPGLDWMPEASFGRSTRWLSICTVAPDAAGITAGELIAALARRNIEARHVWNPMHRQPVFSGCKYYPHEKGVSFSDQCFAQGVCLPSGSNLTEDQIDRICSAILDILS